MVLYPLDDTHVRIKLSNHILYKVQGKDLPIQIHWITFKMHIKSLVDVVSMLCYIHVF